MCDSEGRLLRPAGGSLPIHHPLASSSPPDEKWREDEMLNLVDSEEQEHQQGEFSACVNAP